MVVMRYGGWGSSFMVSILKREEIVESEKWWFGGRSFLEN